MKPRAYFIENPATGSMKDYITNRDVYTFDYCMYGFPYRKRTHIWSNIRLISHFCDGSHMIEKKHAMTAIGSTFTSRLWCAVEIFVYLHMGGKHEGIHTYPFGFRDVLELSERSQRFNATEAECFSETDRQSLLAVIESGFGEVKPFNYVINRTSLRQAFTRRWPDGHVLRPATHV